LGFRSKVAANVGRISEGNKSLTSLEGSGLYSPPTLGCGLDLVPFLHDAEEQKLSPQYESASGDAAFK
jgi:hypothetical protein